MMKFQTQRILLVLFLVLLAEITALPNIVNDLQTAHTNSRDAFVTEFPQNNVSPTPIIIIPTRTSIPVRSPAQTSQDPWGVAKQVGEHTYTMRVGEDEKMTTPQELFDALNNYRQKHGRGILGWDNTLATSAQNRAEYFEKRGGLDAHAGFSDFIKNQDGFNKLGFYALGENSSYGYRLAGVHLIEWIYAADAAHNDNQLSSSWSHVGIGVSGSSTDLVFGGNKK